MKNIINAINIINVSTKIYHVCETTTKDKTKYTKNILIFSPEIQKLQNLLSP